jgi:putative peptidoglycan lipid II flippase
MKVKRQHVVPTKMNNFFAKAQNTILSAAFILFVSSGANAVLSLLKNRLLAGKFGVSDDLAIFYTADRIPNLVYSVLVVGALSTIFIPLFTEELKKDREKAYSVASTLINTLFLFFVALCAIAWVFAPQLIMALGVGTFTSEQIALGAQIMRLMLVSQLLLVAGSLASSVLQSYRMFIIPALAPLAYNVGMILGIMFLSDRFGIMGPTYGTLIGSVLHFVIQIPFITKTGFVPSLKLDLKNKVFKEVAALAPPRILSVLITNGLATVNNSLAILISASSVVYLKFGIQLQSFPVTLFGASIAAASLPTLSIEAAEKDLTKFKKTFLTSFHQMMFLVLPASAALLVLRVPIVRIVYGVSNFPWDATLETAMVLGIFTLSIFPQSANYLISRAFYALKDTITPVKVSMFTIVINVSLSLFFINYMHWGVWSVALSYVITSFLDMILLLRGLSKKTGGFMFRTVAIPFFKITLAAFLMAVTLYVPIKLLDRVIFDTGRTLNLLVLTGIAVVCGTGTYFMFTSMLKIPEIELFYKVLRKLNLRKAELPQSNVDTM